MNTRKDKPVRYWIKKIPFFNEDLSCHKSSWEESSPWGTFSLSEALNFNDLLKAVKWKWDREKKPKNLAELIICFIFISIILFCWTKCLNGDKR